MIYQPLKTEFRINEDKGFIQDQIKARVNQEANYQWAKTPISMSDKERIEWKINQGRDYLKGKKI